MKTEVSIEAKKEFIRWFLKRYHLKRRECNWILNYLIAHEQFLKNVHFTNEAHHCPRAMEISTSRTENIPFRFYKGDAMSADAEKVFHDVRLNPNDALYIQLNFPDKHTCPHYAAVHVENPYLPAHLNTNEQDRKVADQFLASLGTSNLMREIDAALDAKDKELFMQLTAQLKELEVVTV